MTVCEVSSASSRPFYRSDSCMFAWVVEPTSAHHAHHPSSIGLIRITCFVGEPLSAQHHQQQHATTLHQSAKMQPHLPAASGSKPHDWQIPVLEGHTEPPKLAAACKQGVKPHEEDCERSHAKTTPRSHPRKKGEHLKSILHSMSHIIVFALMGKEVFVCLR